MKLSILKLSVIAALLATPVAVYSQTSNIASILPPAKTTFFDKNGKPLAAGTVDFYIPGTTTRKTTWQDAGQTIPNTNPVVLDTSGRGLILGDGSYRQVVKDKNGNVIWDQVTSSTGSSGGGPSTIGDGDPVGTIKAWSGFITPSQYVFAYGQEVPRASYPELFQAIVYQAVGNCTIGSALLSGLPDTSQISIGSNIESPCFNAGSTVINKTTSTITASSNAIISTTSMAMIFPYGNGNGSYTFNIPDLRGRVIAGRDNMGGVAANRLTVASGLGVQAGSQSYFLQQSSLPNIAPTFTGNSMTATASLPTVAVNPTPVAIGGGGFTLYGVSPDAGVFFATNPFTPSGTVSSINGNTDQTAVSALQPTQAYNYIIKVTPDVGFNPLFGVASIGGMTGIIECGYGLSCVGNNISVNTVTQFDIYNVSSIQDLKNIAPNTYKAALVNSYYLNSKGGGGYFYWDSTSNQNDDGCSIFAPIAGGIGRWKRTVKEAMTSLNCGAKNDGSSDDTAAITRLITYAKNFGISAHIVMSEGTSVTTSKLTFDVPDYTILEWNTHITFKGTPSSNDAAIQIGDRTKPTTGIKLLGRGVDITASNIVCDTESRGVEFVSLFYGEFRIANIYNFYYGAFVWGLNYGLSYNQFYMGVLSNKYDLWLDTYGAGGYTNENTFYGGEYTQFPAWTTPCGFSGTNIFENYSSVAQLNNNKFFGPSLETVSNLTRAIDTSGINTQFYGLRAETFDTPASNYFILLRAQSSSIRIDNAYMDVLQVDDAGTGNRYSGLNGTVDKSLAGSCTGLPSKTVYNNAGVVTLCP